MSEPIDPLLDPLQKWGIRNPLKALTILFIVIVIPLSLCVWANWIPADVRKAKEEAQAKHEKLEAKWRVDARLRQIENAKKEEEEREKQRLTLTHFLTVESGWLKVDIDGLTGFRNKGQLVSQSGPFQSYTWQNPDGSNMVATFEHGRLARKAQFGLRYGNE